MNPCSPNIFLSYYFSSRNIFLARTCLRAVAECSRHLSTCVNFVSENARNSQNYYCAEFQLFLLAYASCLPDAPPRSYVIPTLRVKLTPNTTHAGGGGGREATDSAKLMRLFQARSNTS